MSTIVTTIKRIGKALKAASTLVKFHPSFGQIRIDLAGQPFQLPSKEAPLRVLTLYYPQILIGRPRRDSLGESFIRIGISAQTDIEVATEFGYWLVKVVVLGFGVSFSKQTEY